MLRTARSLNRKRAIRAERSGRGSARSPGLRGVLTGRIRCPICALAAMGNSFRLMLRVFRHEGGTCAGLGVPLGGWRTLQSPKNQFPTAAIHMRFDQRDLNIIGRWSITSEMPERYGRSVRATDLLPRNAIAQKTIAGWAPVDAFRLRCATVNEQGKANPLWTSRHRAYWYRRSPFAPQTRSRNPLHRALRGLKLRSQLKRRRKGLDSIPREGG